MKKLFFATILTLTIFGGLWALKPVSADVGVFDNIDSCRTDGDCSLCDFMTMSTNLGRWILSVVGGLALVYFVYAGMMFIISLGNQERVTKAKGVLTGAVTGIVIILGAWMIVNLVFMALVVTTDTKGGAKVWGSTPWSTLEGYCK